MLSDKILKKILLLSGISISLIIVIIFITLLINSLPSIKDFGLKFFIGKEWNPVTDSYSIFPFIVGTFITSIIALIISIPFSLAIAIFLGEYHKEGIINKILNETTQLLAAIPSVIYGFWGIFFLIPIMRNIQIKLGYVPYGVGIMTSSIILAIMIIPYTASISREIIKMVPKDLKEAGYAMGATRFEVILKIILPYAKSGIFAGIFLALGRAMGETMAVTMMIGNSNNMPENIFSPANTMASVIANEFNEAMGQLHLSSLIEIGLSLFLITIIVNFLGNLIIERTKINE